MWADPANNNGGRRLEDDVGDEEDQGDDRVSTVGSIHIKLN